MFDGKQTKIGPGGSEIRGESYRHMERWLGVRATDRKLNGERAVLLTMHVGTPGKPHEIWVPFSELQAALDQPDISNA